MRYRWHTLPSNKYHAILATHGGTFLMDTDEMIGTMEVWEVTSIGDATGEDTEECSALVYFFPISFSATDVHKAVMQQSQMPVREEILDNILGILSEASHFIMGHVEK